MFRVINWPEAGYVNSSRRIEELVNEGIALLEDGRNQSFSNKSCGAQTFLDLGTPRLQD
jgi:hypothetical protein